MYRTGHLTNVVEHLNMSQRNMVKLMYIFDTNGAT